MLSAFHVGRWLYRRELRGLLQARPPRTRTGRARCRCCGAELPDSRDPLIRCRHCRTHSLVTPALQAEQSAALVAEGLVDRRRHELALQRTARIGRAMELVWTPALLLGYFVSTKLMYLPVALLNAIS